AAAGRDPMWADEVASRSLCIELIAVEPGHAVLAMSVTEKMVNGHDICHGGYIFTLADSAFAFACNTYNERTVAQQCAITFVAAAQRGDRLVARATERLRAGRAGVYDGTGTRGGGVVIARFRRHSRPRAGGNVPGLKSRAPARAKA